MAATWLGKLIKGQLGWKTVTASIVLVALVIGVNYGWVSNEQFERFTKLAEALGLIGLRDAFSKLPKT